MAESNQTSEIKKKKTLIKFVFFFSNQPSSELLENTKYSIRLMLDLAKIVPYWLWFVAWDSGLDEQVSTHGQCGRCQKHCYTSVQGIFQLSCESNTIVLSIGKVIFRCALCCTVTAQNKKSKSQVRIPVAFVTFIYAWIHWIHIFSSRYGLNSRADWALGSRLSIAETNGNLWQKIESVMKLKEISKRLSHLALYWLNSLKGCLRKHIRYQPGIWGGLIEFNAPFSIR